MLPFCACLTIACSQVSGYNASPLIDSSQVLRVSGFSVRPFRGHHSGTRSQFASVSRLSPTVICSTHLGSQRSLRPGTMLRYLCCAPQARVDGLTRYEELPHRACPPGALMLQSGSRLTPTVPAACVVIDPSAQGPRDIAEAAAGYHLLSRGLSNKSTVGRPILDTADTGKSQPLWANKSADKRRKLAVPQTGQPLLKYVLHHAAYSSFLVIIPYKIAHQ
jgi:hypothetical protein